MFHFVICICVLLALARLTAAAQLGVSGSAAAHECVGRAALGHDDSAPARTRRLGAQMPTRHVSDCRLGWALARWQTLSRSKPPSVTFGSTRRAAKPLALTGRESFQMADIGRCAAKNC